MKADIIYNDFYDIELSGYGEYRTVWIDKEYPDTFPTEKEAWDYCISCGVNSCDINVYD